MKRLYPAIAATAAILVLAAVSAPSASAAAKNDKGLFGANIPAGTYNIVFDGYCDGMAITIPGSAGAPGVEMNRTGSCTSSDFLYGVLGGISVGGADATYSLYTVIMANGTWMYYADCGTGSECVVNSGTWSFGVPAAPGKNLLPSTSRAGRVFGGDQQFVGAGRVPGPNAIHLDVSYDGYCDGEHINVPGDAGAPGADGYQTGCVGNPLIGARHGNGAAMWSYLDGLLWYNMTDGTWVIYGDGGGYEIYINSGTWSFGTPAPQHKRTAVPSAGR